MYRPGASIYTPFQVGRYPQFLLEHSIFKDHTGTQYYVIDKIYKLKGKEQAREIRERLSKN
jgi:hypothetical protein